MRDDLSRRTMIQTAMKAPYLEREEEHQLAVRWEKRTATRQALHRITMSHMRLVISMASKFRSFGLSMGDLIQEGHIGLLEAAARFDPSRESSASRPTPPGGSVRPCRITCCATGRSLRGGTSSTQKALFFNLRRLRAKLAGNGEQLTVGDIHRQISGTLGVVGRGLWPTWNARLSGPDTSHQPAVTDEGGSAAERYQLPALERAFARRSGRRDDRYRAAFGLAQDGTWRTQRTAN